MLTAAHVDPLLFTVISLALMGAIAWWQERQMRAFYPELKLPAQVVSLRQERRHVPRDTKMRAGKVTVCYATFRYAGIEREHRISRSLYQLLSAGELGLICVQGEWFKGFDLPPVAGRRSTTALQPNLQTVPLHEEAAD